MCVYTNANIGSVSQEGLGAESEGPWYNLVLALYTN